MDMICKKKNKVTCSCGKLYEVFNMYVGDQSKCPSCRAKDKKVWITKGERPMRKFLMGIVSLCLVLSVVGCASRTRVNIFGLQLGGYTEAHEPRPIGVSKNAQGENVLCLGVVSLATFAAVDENAPVPGCSVTSHTGRTADVNRVEETPAE